MDRDISVGLDLNEVSHALKKRKWVVVVFTLLLTAAGIAYGFFIQKDLYQVHFSYFMLLEENVDSSNIEAAIEGIVKSNTFAKQVSSYIRDDMDYKEIQQLVRVTSVANRIIIINVSSETPESVIALANAVSQTFLEITPQYIPMSIKAVDQPSIDSITLNSKGAAIILAALLAGLILSASLALLLNYLQPTIVTEADVVRYLGLPCLGYLKKMKQHYWTQGELTNDQEKVVQL